MPNELRLWRVLDNPEFHRVWQRWQTGDQHVWNDLVYDVIPLLKRWCRAGALAEDEALDVIQGVLLALIEATKKSGRAPPHSFIGWLRQVAHNKIAEWFRRRPEEKLILDYIAPPLASPGRRVPPSPKCRRVRKAIRQVRPLFREKTWQAFWLTVVEKHPLKQVAAQLGMTANAVDKARRRVRERFRRACIDCGWENGQPHDETPKR